MGGSAAYISAQQAAMQWGISKRRVLTLCSARRIPEAVRIGNMWVVPTTAQKPPDARKRAEIQLASTLINPVKSARKALKAISAAAYQIAVKELEIASEAKKSVMAIFTQELIRHTLPEGNSGLDDATVLRVCKMLDLHTLLSETASYQISELFRSFPGEHPFCIDDALSWAYQYINKMSMDTGLETTQFFTEKYMITALIDQCGIDNSDKKILDPACGGGSFLLYALDYLCDNAHKQGALVSPEYVNAQLKRLYGYDLDSSLAVIASINLRLKALTILKSNGYKITVNDFFTYEPFMYHSVNNNIAGTLDPKPGGHLLIRVGTDATCFMSELFSSAEYIFTNPPFQTVKGMADLQKDFLKEHYPNAKCDMCNAFIEMILRSLNKNGICGLVTQNSWMYLDSFRQLRLSLLQKYSFVSIIELGSNAFYDLSGEKANVVLLTAKNVLPDGKSKISVTSVKHLSQSDMESLLSCGVPGDNMPVLNQQEILKNPGYRIGVMNNNWTQHLHKNNPLYGEYAVPMQGTSTGDSKSLVGYFWEHIGDTDWCLVSKGGGYSRWLGLNNYSVKWGKDGEYIKNTQGSAIRNAKYFSDTQLVFSDTGTAGLNTRLLVDNQIFIASGPGIRITNGEALSHMAFLNSRYSSYFMKLLSPKLTIAAGYITKIPTALDVLSSSILTHNAQICIDSKRNRLSKRPINYEFINPVDAGHDTTLNEQAVLWFLCDMEDEWLQLCAEYGIDKEITANLKLSDFAQKDINTLVGCHALDITGSTDLPNNQLDHIISEILSENCTLTRTRPSKNHLGCDGIIEYLSHKLNVAPSRIYHSIKQNTNEFAETINKYRDAYIHNVILSALGYTVHSLPVNLPRTQNVLLRDVALKYPSLIDELSDIDEWIGSRLTQFHRAAFFDRPIIQYSAERETVELTR